MSKDRFLKYINPYKGVLFFVIILLVSHFAWKFLVLGDESDSMVTFLGMNISYPFNFMAHHVASFCQRILEFFGSDIRLEPGNILRHGNGNAVRIIWGCTAIKQAYIFICIIGLNRGPWRKKLWYIPLGLVVIYFFNILRISIIAQIIGAHPTWFDFFHEHIFKYLFYLVIFGMWVYWEEKIVLPSKVKKEN